ncbi:glycosyltransferase [Mucilaginibacter dorajii]|uniref:Glycosyl transferase family 1 domain-containing protein n=1 Tax=Mucilaginibacter dorajii TaxID=692994 RepID=A0ABP7PJT7_9SPHI|nr:glycosyltransferase [Mucilaginibacter dorajii]MCS3733430.1 glycosyltransferase involved in cell wall biosynthesis [Mucilaginibacter dorajii]
MKKTIFYVGYNVFPVGFGQTQRELLISKGLTEKGCRVVILCRYGTYAPGKIANILAEGTFDGVEYKYCSGSAYRGQSFFKRNLKKLKGFLNEIGTIIKGKMSGDLKAILITTNSFDNILLYSILGKLLNVQTVIDNTEYWTAVKRHKFALGDKLYDKYSYKIIDKVICISDFLLEKSASKKPAALVKIPSIVDFSKFESFDFISKPGFEYFLFCGSAVYYPVIEFIINAFNLIQDRKISLVLICGNGGKGDYDKIDQKIAASNKKDLIHFKSNLAYSELVGWYKGSLALLIPLRPTNEDAARFPHKIGEYCASKRPIVTTNFGEIMYYFKDGVNAFVSGEYEPQSYANALQNVLKDKNVTEMIASRSFETGKNNFDYTVCGETAFNLIYNSY